MGKQLFTNNATCKIQTALTLASSSLALDADYTKFPTIAPASGDWFYVTLVNPLETIFEICKVTATSGATWSVQRGQDSTSVKEWPAQTTVELRPIAQSFREMQNLAETANANASAAEATANTAMTTANNALPASSRGAANGVASLGADSKVPVSQLPSYANAYDLAGYWQGKPANGATIFYLPIVRALTLPVNLGGSSAKSRVVTTASTTYIIKKNGSQIGTMTFGVGASTATFSFLNPINFTPGDILQIDAPATADATHADIGFSLFATLT